MSLVYLLGVMIVIMCLTLLSMSHRKLNKAAGYLALLAPILSSIYFIFQISNVIHHKFTTVHLPWMSSIDINLDLKLDGLSLMLSLIISLIGVGVFFYATQYLLASTDNLPRFFVYLLLFMFSMIGIVISNNTILMYIFWELTSISSFLLISYWYNNGGYYYE